MRTDEETTPSESRSFRWVRVSDDELAFHLTENEEPVAVVRWQEGRSRDGLIQAPSGRWMIRPQGFWSPQVVVLDAESQAEVGRLSTNWRQGRFFSVFQGPTYPWNHVQMPTEEWWFSDELGRKVVRFRDAVLERKEFVATADVLRRQLPGHHVDLLLVAGLYWVLFDLALRGQLKGTRYSIAAIGAAHR